MKEIAGILKGNEGINIMIVGYTDSDGDETKNLKLSKKRAASVKNFLTIEFKIAPTLISDCISCLLSIILSISVGKSVSLESRSIISCRTSEELSGLTVIVVPSTP